MYGAEGPTAVFLLYICTNKKIPESKRDKLFMRILKNKQIKKKKIKPMYKVQPQYFYYIFCTKKKKPESKRHSDQRETSATP